MLNTGPGVWELGNELENFALLQPCETRDDGRPYPCEWGTASGDGPLHYYGPRWEKVSAVLRGLSDGVQAGNPNALRAMGTAGWGHTGAFDRMAEDGIEWDISVWHQYAGDNSRQLERVAAHGRPIWVTELNGANGSHESNATNVERLQPLLDWYVANAARYDVRAVFIYELFDEPYWDNFEGDMGLFYLDQSPYGFDWVPGAIKPAGELFQRYTGQNPLTETP